MLLSLIFFHKNEQFIEKRNFKEILNNYLKVFDFDQNRKQIKQIVIP